MKRLLVCGLLCAAVCCAESRWHRAWKWSVAALAAGNAADIASSMGKWEVNPMLCSADGRFGARGAVLKTAIVAGPVLAEWLVLRRSRRGEKVFSIVNFAAAGAVSGVAVRNLRLHAGRPGGGL